MRFPLCFAMLLVASATLPVAAEAIADRRGGADVRMTLADLPAHPAFEAFLRDDADAIANNYAADNAREVIVEERITRADARFASVLRRTMADLGGAHPNTYLEALVWDASVADFIRLDAFFDAGAPRDEALITISRHLREVIRKRVWNGTIDPIFLPLVEQATNPDPAVMANFTLEDGGIAFHYSPYEVAPYAAGPVSIMVPVAVFSQWMNGTGQIAIR